jgi:hypothetical protein
MVVVSAMGKHIESLGTLRPGVAMAACALAGCEKDFVPYGTGYLELETWVLLAIVGIVALVAVIVWRFRGRSPWRKVLTKDMQMKISDDLKTDRRFIELRRQVEARFPTTFDRTDEFLTYRICFLALCNQTGRFLEPGHPEAVVLVAYLRRKAKPSRIKIEMDVRTGKIRETEIDKPHWDMVVPDL